jgi:hypothetical protein
VRLVRFLSPFLAALVVVLTVSCGGNTRASDEARVNVDASVLEIGYSAGESATGVTKNLTLPTKGTFEGAAIAWASSQPVALSTTGTVNRPPYGADLSVTLTATLTLGAAQATKAFVVSLKQVETVQFIFTSDCHFGDVTSSTATTKFQGTTTTVDALEVNTRARDAMNTLPSQVAPSDYGVNSGKAFGNFDFMANTGDFASRSVPVPASNGNSAAQSFAQWESVYVTGLTLKDNTGAPLPHFLTPGNHDISNALGGPEAMVPTMDPTAFVKIYNRMMNPATALTNAAFDYNLHKVFYTKVMGGVHFVFLNQWLDAEMREKLATYLNGIPVTTPVVLFAHMPPEQAGLNFRNPASNMLDFPWAGGFANYFRDKMDASNILAPATTITTATVPTKEVTDLAVFLKARTNIVAWFNGHDNFNQFRTWNGENSVLITNTMTQLSIPVFRADSPMKGKDSGKDARKLSFQVVSLDPAKKLITVRECLWNKNNTPGGAIGWGVAETFSLENRVR